MSQRKYNFVPGEFYHIYNRGVDKRIIFLDKNDYERFQVLLHILNTKKPVNIRDVLRSANDPFTVINDEPLIAIGAYCFMPNHFHILATPVVDGGMSSFMQKLSTSYTMYFNKKYGRSGALFEGKFKSQFVESDRYMKYLFSYIHLNPVKIIQSDWKEKGITDLSQTINYLSEYNYSSYLEVSGQTRPESAIVNEELFPNYFNGVTEAQNEINDWLTFSLGKT